MSRARLALEPMEDRTVPTVVTIEAVADVVEGSVGLFRLTRSDTSGGDSVSYSTGGTATADDDFILTPKTATFEPGETVTFVEVDTYDDATAEPTETAVLTLDPGAGYTVGTSGTATLNIFDNDAPVVSVAKVADAAEAGSNGTFRFTRIGDLSSSLTANYTVSGTATSGTDFTALSGTVTFATGSSTADVTVTVSDDFASELTETVVVTLGTGTGYTVGANDTATVNILDNDAQIVTVAKIADAVEGQSNEVFRFTRIGDLTNSLAVSYTVSGTATSGTDYTALSGSVTFAAGEANADVMLSALHDALYDPNTTVVVTADAGTGYTVGTEGTATTQIHEDTNLTFKVGSSVGAVWYTVAWADVDPTEASQSVALTNFAITLGGETFYDSDCVSAPTARFEYGVFKGIDFDIDTHLLASYAYDSIAIGGFAVSVFDRLTSQVINDTAVDFGGATLKFNNATNDLPRWKAELTLTYALAVYDEFGDIVDWDTASYTYSREFNAATEDADIVTSLKSVLEADGIKVSTAVNDTRLIFTGVAGALITDVVYKTYKNPVNGNWTYDKNLSKPGWVAGSSGTSYSINP